MSVTISIPELLMMVLQLLCAGSSAWSGLWWRSLYWVGALVLTLAVVKGLNA